MKRIFATIFFIAFSFFILQNSQAIATYFPAIKFIDNNNTIFGVKQIDNKIRTVSQDYMYSIAEEEVSGHVVVRLFGSNGDIDNTREDIWEVGGTYQFPPIASQVRLVSTSVNDASGSTGAYRVHLTYLDESFIEREEYIYLTGTTATNSVATNVYRINDFHVASAGTNLAAVGNISVTNNANTQTYAYISANNTLQRQLVYTVPASKTLYITKTTVSNFTAGDYTEVTFRSKQIHGYNTDVFFPSLLYLAPDAVNTDNLTIPIKIIAKSDFKASGISTGGSSNAVVAVSVEGWVEDN